jgi:hypothetical protein
MMVAFRLAELAAGITALSVFNRSVMGDDEYEKIDPRVRARNFIVATGTQDEFGRQQFIKIPKTPELIFPTSIFEGQSDKGFDEGVMDEGHAHWEAFRQSVPLMDDPMLVNKIPVVSAVRAYYDNYDVFKKRKIVNNEEKLEDWAEYDKDTGEFWKNLGKSFSTIDEDGNRVGGLSPERTRTAISKVTSNIEGNLGLNVVENALNKASGGNTKTIDVLKRFYGAADDKWKAFSESGAGAIKRSEFTEEEVIRRDIRAMVESQNPDKSKSRPTREDVEEIKAFISELKPYQRKAAARRYKSYFLAGTERDYQIIDIAMESNDQAKARMYYDLTKDMNQDQIKDVNRRLKISGFRSSKGFFAKLKEIKDRNE